MKHSRASADGVGDSKCIQKIIINSKTSGSLNISNRQLQEVPLEVFQLSETDDSVKWWEAVDLIKIDLSHNSLNELPAQLWDLTALVTLLASNNSIQRLLPGVSALTALRMLDLSNNPLGPALLEEVAELPSLATLNLASCGLLALPVMLGGPQQPKLVQLNISNNALTGLPDGLSCASALVVLKSSSNQISQLPSKLVQSWAALKELDVSNNKLQELPAELGGLSSLTQLDARRNQLSDIPVALGQAAALCDLLLGFNQISTLPTTLGMLSALKTLDLRNNIVEVFPDELCGLQLVLLDLTNNCLRRLPPALGAMTTLRSIPLDGNPLKLMRRELWAGPVSALLQHLRDQNQTFPDSAGSPPSQVAAGTCSALSAPAGSLCLRGRGLTSVPADVWKLGSLSSLDASDNNLANDAANMTAGLSQLCQLRALSLNSCALHTWPLAGLSAGSLPALHSLELRFNPLGMSPLQGLDACPRLKSLDLSGVQGLQLPDTALSCVPELEVLIACRAGLREVPAAVWRATSLKRLNMSSNSISSIDVAVTQLTRLQELDIQNNQVSGLPPQLGLMAPTLRVLLLEGNCIRVIRRAVLEKGTAAVLDWLKDRIPT